MRYKVRNICGDICYAGTNIHRFLYMVGKKGRNWRHKCVRRRENGHICHHTRGELFHWNIRHRYPYTDAYNQAWHYTVSNRFSSATALGIRSGFRRLKETTQMLNKHVEATQRIIPAWKLLQSRVTWWPHILNREVVTGSLQSAWLHGSQHFFLHLWPQGNVKLHNSLQRSRVGSVEHANSISCPHSGITFVIIFLYELFTIENYASLKP